MARNKSMVTLPGYKSNEFNVDFKLEIKDGNLIQKFKKDGELDPETEVKIKKCYDYHSYKRMLMEWERPTGQGKETINLADIYPTDGFLEFMDKFLEKKGLFGKHWLTTYGAIVAICKLCEKDPDKFKKLIRKAESISELLMISGFRD